MKGGFEQYYRDYNLKSKSEGKYAQDYCLKILLYVDKDREDDFDIIEEKDNKYEDFKKLDLKYKDLYGEKYTTQFQLLHFRNLSFNCKIKTNEIKKMFDIIKNNSSKYKFAKDTNPFSFISVETLKELSFQDIEIIRNNNLYLFEEFPTLTPKVEAILSLKRNTKYNPFNRIKLSRKGAEIFQHILQRMDPESILIILKNRILKNSNLSFFKTKFYTKQYRIFNSFFETKTNPGWIILTNIPVLPPTLRPFIEIETGQLISSDINEIYRLLIIRNNRLAVGLFRYEHPEQILFFTRQTVQQTVDSLIDNARVSQKKTIQVNDRPLRGLTEILEGKFGRFRFTLLGKRVDYSGRSVIAVNPQLKINQCGLPYLIGIEIYKPLLIKDIITRFLNSKDPIYKNVKKSSIILTKNFPIVWRLLEILMNESTVLLNRAPTLHKFGIQAFDPFPILGQAIQIHPLVCTGFNADFDGDQMAVHLPLYRTSQLEIKSIMRPISNIFSPSNGEIIIKPSQDIVIGCYYLTMMINKRSFNFKYFFSTEQEALGFFYRKKINIHTPILVRYLFSNFLLHYDRNKLIISSIYDYSSKFKKSLFSENIEIYKIFQAQLEQSKIYFFTNIGIFFAKKRTQNIYEIKELFFETNPGRILFNSTLKSIFK
jgi:DNA-directed RNA polymerase beta' subunit